MTTPETPAHDTSPLHHVAPQRPTRPYMERVIAAVGGGLEQIRAHHGAASIELMVGFSGRQVAPLLIQADDHGPTCRALEASFDAMLQVGAWTRLIDPFGDDVPVVTAALRGGTQHAGPIALEEAEATQLAISLHVAGVEHMAAIVADAPEEWAPHTVEEGPDPLAPGAGRTSKAWIYDLFSHLPGLLGVDHSAGLLLPDRLSQPDPDASTTYVVAAEQLFVSDPGSPLTPEHLVGLLIPCGGGRGGLLEVALERQRRDPLIPYHLFIQMEDEGGEDAWLALGDAEEQEEDATFYRFTVDAVRAPERMMVLIPLALPLDQPGFLGLSFRSPAPIAMATAVLFERLGVLFADALSHSDLFRVPVKRFTLFEAFAEATDGAPHMTRRALLARLTPALYERLGARSVAIGLLSSGDDGEERLEFENPQGWDLDQPRALPYRTADSLAALAMRLDRTLVLTGGRPTHPGSPSLRWNNTLYVNERLGQVVDRRLAGDLELSVAAGWRPLADYYRPTGAESVYAAVVVPLRTRGEVVGVLGLDFDREAPWQHYSGFAAQGLYEALSQLIASHLALLPQQATGTPPGP